MRTPRGLPPLPPLKVFEAAARLLSFKAAAAELNVTQSAVSHQIAALERHLGTRLFNRHPGRVALNAAGATYYPLVQDALARIAAATGLVQRDSRGSPLMIQVYVTVAVRWLIPQLHTFKQAFPDIAVNIDAGSLDWDFNPDKADVGIVYRRDEQRTGIAYTLLRRENLTAVCARSLAGSIRTVDDLCGLPRLSLTTGDEDWQVWSSAMGLRTAANGHSHSFDSYLLAIEAAADGQGFVVAPQFLVEKDIRAGNLAVAVQSNIPQPGGWYFACAQERAHEASIRSFRGWIKSLSTASAPPAGTQ